MSDDTPADIHDVMNTVVGLKAQDCPGGGWTGQPADLERPTVADCLAHGVCGCIYGDAVQHIERLHAVARDNQKLAAARGIEIERLRAENIATGRLNEQLVKSLADATVEIKRLRRENEVMKAADYEALTKPAT